MINKGGVARLWVLYSADGTYEQCIGAIIDGVAAGHPNPRPRFMALASFAKLDPQPTETRIVLDVPSGRERKFEVRRVLDTPATRPNRQHYCETMAEVTARLDVQRAELKAAGWWEGELDPIADPD